MAIGGGGYDFSGVGLCPSCDACEAAQGFYFKIGGEWSINPNPSLLSDNGPPQVNLFKLFDYCAAKRLVGGGNRHRKRGRRGDDLIDEKIQDDTSSSEIPTIAAAATGVSPALTSDPRALEVPTISPAARRFENSRAAAGSSFARISSAIIAPSGFNKLCKICLKDSLKAAPCGLCSEQRRGNSATRVDAVLESIPEQCE